MWSVKNWAGEALKMPTVNYLQRETQTRPVFKTYRMDTKNGISLARSKTSVTSLVTIPNFKWPADRWRSSPGNARMKYKGVPISMQNTQVIESWKPKTPREVPRSKKQKDENINQIYDCEESERKSESQPTRPTTKYEKTRTRPEDCIRVNTALPGRRRLLVSRQGHNPDKFIFDNQMSRGQACPIQCPTGTVSPRDPSRFVVRRHSLSQLHRKEVQNQNNKFISSTGDHIHNGLTKTLPSIKEPYSIRGRF